MDDGLQNPSLKKDLSVAVIDGAAGAGNGLVIPAGPLRASIEAQWPLVDIALIIGDGIAGDALARAAADQGKPVFRGKLVPDADVAAQLRGRRVLAFAGIGHPDKFFGTLREIGALVERAVPFPDHHRFGERQLSALLEDAQRENLVLVTTEKDAARMASPVGGGAVTTLPVRLEVEDESALRRLVVGAVIPGPRSGPGIHSRYRLRMECDGVAPAHWIPARASAPRMTKGAACGLSSLFGEAADAGDALTCLERGAGTGT